MLNQKVVFQAFLALALIFGIQSISQAQFKFGLKSAVTTSSFSDQEGGLFSKLGLSAGAFADIQIKRIGLRVEGNGIYQGSEGHFWQNDETKVLYANVPAMIRYMPVKNLYIGGGAALNYKILGNTTSNEKMGMDVLADIEYRFGNKIGVNLRYTHGIPMGGNAPSSIFPRQMLQAGLTFALN